MKTGIIYDPVYLKHETGTHPECKERVRITAEQLKTGGYGFIKPRKAARKELMLNHSLKYIEHVEHFCREGGGIIDPDTIVSPMSFEAASFAAGAALEAADQIVEGKSSRMFCLVRPPGHHALRNCSMGFCLFNNVALGARYALDHYGLKRILVVDIDLHHGNGTQDAFYREKEVLYFSVHQSHYYPGTGSSSEEGEGEGKGYTMNVPLAAGSGDREYISALREILLARSIDFDPQLIFVSAGFDAYEDDPLGAMKVSIEGFGEIGRIINNIGLKTCNKIISCLEGGYNIDKLPMCIKAYIKGAEG